MAGIRTFHEWDWLVLRPLRRTLELAPANAKAIRLAGLLARFQGCLEEALAHHRRALELDPLSTLDHGHLGLTLYAADRQAEAERAYRMALELAPQRSTARSHLRWPCSRRAGARRRWRRRRRSQMSAGASPQRRSSSTPWEAARSRTKRPHAHAEIRRGRRVSDRRGPRHAGRGGCRHRLAGARARAARRRTHRCEDQPALPFSTATRGGTGS